MMHHSWATAVRQIYFQSKVTAVAQVSHLCLFLKNIQWQGDNLIQRKKKEEKKNSSVKETQTF